MHFPIHAKTDGVDGWVSLDVSPLSAYDTESTMAYQELLESERFQRMANSGARMQRLLWASTSAKDPNAWTRYVASWHELLGFAPQKSGAVRST